MTTMSKRTFLKSVAASSLAFGSLSSRAIEATPAMRWDAETDVLVIGYGGAGACCAIEAAKSGSNVLILEKMERPGGNTAVSSGGFMIPDDKEKAWKYLRATYDFAAAECDEELISAYCEEAENLKNFLKEIDPENSIFVYGYAGFKTLEGADTIKRYRVKAKKGQKRQGSGDYLFNVLIEGVNQRKIPVWLNCPAVQLIRRGNEVIGAVAVKDQKRVNIKAKKAVVLTTGGYEFDPESMHTYCVGTHFNGKGNPGNTGDGLRMAQSMGAKLWHMNAYSAYMAPKFPGAQTAIDSSPKGPSFIWVDQDGRRFANEKTDGHCQMYTVMWLDAVRHLYPRIPCYMVFDQATLDKGPLGSALGSGYAVNREGLKWTRDLKKEVQAGVVKCSSTIKGLAAEIGVPPENLEETVQKWNSDMEAGRDSQFGRPLRAQGKGTYIYDAPELSAAIEKGPYYAIEMFPILVNTQGGPKKNVKAQVLDVFDQPIPRLYCAGELGSMWGPIYQGACNIGEAMIFGRIAGRAASAEESWG